MNTVGKAGRIAPDGVLTVFFCLSAPRRARFPAYCWLRDGCQAGDGGCGRLVHQRLQLPKALGPRVFAGGTKPLDVAWCCLVHDCPCRSPLGW